MKTDKYAKIVEPSIQSARKRLNKNTIIRNFKLEDKYFLLSPKCKYLTL